jgi:hypothetical protein
MGHRPPVNAERTRPLVGCVRRFGGPVPAAAVEFLQNPINLVAPVVC